MATKKKVIKKVVPVKSGDVPATAKMLYFTEQKLSAKISGVETKLSAVESRLDARISGVEAKLSAVESRLDARISNVEANLDAKISRVETKLSEKIDSLDAKLGGQINDLKSALDVRFFELKVLIEEQNARNIYVLDGYQSLDHRLSKVEGADV